MPRTGRSIEAGVICHELNRGNGRMTPFRKDADFEVFERVLGVIEDGSRSVMSPYPFLTPSG